MANHSNIYDIARDAGVSIATVSRVMSGHANVRPKTREKVLRVAQEQGYRLNLVESVLSQGRSRTLAVILPLIDNPFYSKVYMKIHQEAEAMHHAITLFQVQRASLSFRMLTDELANHRFSGAIISGDTMGEDTYGVDSEHLDNLSAKMPIVLINTPQEPRLPCLAVDLVGSARLAVRHLYRLGHKRIALIGGTGSPRYQNTREFGYVDEMKALGLEEWIYPFTSGESPLEGAVCVSRLLSTCSAHERPTALFAFNDLVAMGAIRQLQKEGYSLPQDMAVVGCDNQLFSAYLNPALTTIDLHIEDICCAAVGLLANGDRQVTSGFYQTVESSLIIRESCGNKLYPD